MAREAVNPMVYSDQYPAIDPRFLFLTDGYNLRSTELNAVLGLFQLPRLESFISIRRNNFARFVKIIEAHRDKFYPIHWDSFNSNYSFPFICKTPELMKTIKKLFTEAGIEHRPLVGGNLLQQPFLKQYCFEVPKDNYNVDLINNNGFYIGNSQFVTKYHLDYLENLLDNIK
jgi:CDP-6-deoxy-D-xylo-4-hexulose-3-dehydrase